VASSSLKNQPSYLAILIWLIFTLIKNPFTSPLYLQLATASRNPGKDEERDYMNFYVLQGISKFYCAYKFVIIFERFKLKPKPSKTPD